MKVASLQESSHVAGMRTGNADAVSVAISIQVHLSVNRDLPRLSLISAALLLVGTVACDNDPEPGAETLQTDNTEASLEPAPYAVAEFNAAESYRTSGNVQFMRLDDLGVRVIGRFTNMPEGTYDLRILQSGDCSAITGQPAQQVTAIDSATEDTGQAELPEGGSIGTLETIEGNLASIDVHVDQLVLEGEGSIIGKPMVIERLAEDDTTAPTERSADQIACGVVARSNVTAAADERTSQ